MAIEQQQIDAFEKLIGKRGSHYDLARECESLGLYVAIDSEDNEHSRVMLQGCWNPDGTDVVIGQVVGDADAEIVTD